MNVRFASIIPLERRIKWEQSWNKRSKTTRLSHVSTTAQLS